MAEYVFLNGQVVPLGEARISPLDRGFQYGDGVFTTLRVESGSALYLSDHLARLTGSLRELRIPLEPLRVVDWSQVIKELLSRNGLRVGPAVVKIIITRGITATLGLPEAVEPTVFVRARSYQPPSNEQYARGWRLHVCRCGHAPPLARHKSLNYLYYLMARQTALDSGADEAVLVDANGRITETASGSLLVRTNGTWWTPESADQLPGVTLAQTERLFRQQGRFVEKRQAGPEALLQAQTIWVLNSLLGIMPVRSVDAYEMPALAAEDASMLRARLFVGGRNGQA